MQTEAVLQGEEHRAGPRWIGDCTACRGAIGGGDDLRDQRPARAQTLGQLRATRGGPGDVEDQLHVEQGGSAEGVLPVTIRLPKGGDEVDGIAMVVQQVEMVAHGSLDVVREHGVDQLVLAVKVGVDGAACEAGGGGNGFQAGPADTPFVEHLGGGREEPLARHVTGRSGARP